MPNFDDQIFDAGAPIIVPVPAVPPSGYLGRFQLGDSVPLFVAVVDNGGFPAIPDAAPVAVVTAPDISSAGTAKLAMQDANPQTFGLGFFLGLHLALGTYSVAYSWQVAGVSLSASGSFDVISGGDPGGSVISLFAYDRPEARYVVAQLSSGALVQGRNPSLG